MILSSFCWDDLKYDYYEAPSIKKDIGGWDDLQGLGIPYSSNSDTVGIDIEEALPDLPPDAVFIGRGSSAKGRVVKPRHKIKSPPSNKLNGLSLKSLGETSDTTISVGAQKTETEEIPLVFFLLPLFAGVALGYGAANKPDSGNRGLVKLGLVAGGIFTGIKIGQEYERFKRKVVAKNAR